MAEMKNDENQIENANSNNNNNNKNSDQTMQEDLPNTKSAHNLMKCRLRNFGKRLKLF